MSQICRISCQNKFVKLVHLFGFIIKKSVTMHGHMNVKYWPYLFGVGGETAGLCTAGSCPAARGIIPVPTASGWTVVVFE